MGEPTSRRHESESAALSSDWTASHETPPAIPPSAEAGFTPGTMLAGRYRVVAQAIAGLAAYGFQASLAGKPMCGRSLLED